MDFFNTSSFLFRKSIPLAGLLLLFTFSKGLSASVQISPRIIGMQDSLSEVNDSTYVILCCNIADEFVNEKNLSRATNYIDSAFVKARAMRNKKLEGYVYNSEGNLYNYVGDATKALDCFEKALKIYIDLGNGIGQRSVYLNKGNTYFGGGDFVKAESCYLMALKLDKVLGHDQSSLADIYNNLGGVCGMQDKYDEAKKYFNKAFDIYILQKDSASMGFTYNNLGNVEATQKHYEVALPYFEKALALKLKFNSNVEKAKAYANVGDINYNMGRNDIALHNFKRSLEFVDTTIFNQQLKKVYEGLANCYEEKKDFAQSQKYYKLLNTMNSKFFSSELESRIEQKELLFEVSKNHLNDSLVQVSRIEKQNIQLAKSNTIRYFLFSIVFIILVFTVLLFRRFKLSQAQKVEIGLQKKLVDEKQKEIVDSITYAKRIQETLLNDQEIGKHFEHFSFFQPKDIVSGDFCWTSFIPGEDLFFLALCDSTGHGVPGAFMSILNASFLNEAINEKHIYQTGKIFDYIRDRLIVALGKEQRRDGFDGVLFCFDLKNKKCTYSAANNAPILIGNGELTNLNCDKMPVGKGEKAQEFSQFSFDWKKGDLLYLFTDGYADQFGGVKGKKYMLKSMRELLLKNHRLPLSEQKKSLQHTFQTWKGQYEQVDDVTIIGMIL